MMVVVLNLKQFVYLQSVGLIKKTDWLDSKIWFDLAGLCVRKLQIQFW